MRFAVPLPQWHSRMYGCLVWHGNRAVWGGRHQGRHDGEHTRSSKGGWRFRAPIPGRGRLHIPAGIAHKRYNALPATDLARLTPGDGYQNITKYMQDWIDGKVKRT